MNHFENVCAIGIAGGSASGKTTIINKLKKQFADEIVMISHDYYYWANDDKSMEERVKLNYDHPQAFETAKLVDDLQKLRNKEVVNLPIYDFTQHTRKKETLTMHPKPVIVVEGILILEDKTLRDLMDIKVFVDTDADERLIRRILRDTQERGRSVASVLGSVVTRYCFLSVCRMFSYQGVKRKALQVMSSIYNTERKTFCPDPKGEARRSSSGVKALDNRNNYSLRALPCLITAYLSQKTISRNCTT